MNCRQIFRRFVIHNVYSFKGSVIQRQLLDEDSNNTKLLTIENEKQHSRIINEKTIIALKSLFNFCNNEGGVEKY